MPNWKRVPFVFNFRYTFYFVFLVEKAACFMFEVLKKVSRFGRGVVYVISEYFDAICGDMVVPAMLGIISPR